jgi:hypothetical protein
MTMYLVERTLPGLTVADLAEAQLALVASCARLSARGSRVRYLRSLLVPDRGRCLCLFEAGAAELVARANDTAQFPFTRIDEVVDLQP